MEKKIDAVESVFLRYMECVVSLHEMDAAFKCVSAVGHSRLWGGKK